MLDVPAPMRSQEVQGTVVVGSYLWTRKIDGKTVTLALSKEQAAVIAEAVARNRTLDRRLADIRTLSEMIIRAITTSVPTRRRCQKPA